MKLLVHLLPYHSTDRYSAAARAAGSRGGTAMAGLTLSRSGVLQFMGLGETPCEILLTIADGEEAAAVAASVSAEAERAGEAVTSLSMNVLAFANAENHLICKNGEREMDEKLRIIATIVNKGCADDVMAVARAAGAKGGTVLQARGTASADDAKFFGVSLVPEKELLLIVADVASAPAIFDAIRECDILKQKGGGIVFSTAAN